MDANDSIFMFLNKRLRFHIHLKNGLWLKVPLYS